MIPILLEDDDIIAVSKPEGLAAIPERDPRRESLLASLSAQLRRELLVVHRIDKEVSGVILFAKNASAHRWLNEQFSKRAVRKTYLALTHGAIEQPAGTIAKPLRQFGSGRVGVDTAQGKLSSTTFEVVKRFASHTLIHANPHTGRRHQIRVHLYSIGHPVVGDLRYGDKAIQSAFPRLMLHALSLELCLPSGKGLAVEAPVPESFSVVMGTIL
ncbi:MAG TPA: RluA family pseudouridine synthase [Syntrophobacteria bacterium]|nr:RluA family pseudouridine synthase [Syntrophobacteria bacterium]